ncbi:MAG: mannose-6-phosphate isomerase, class I [Candidatus Theseobacter exili]|nr:mannose-6-phosphate isomerase, class I [Candidatus Theseobacter exili]
MNQKVNNSFKLEPQPYLLNNRILHYSWGTKGKDAFIPEFLDIETLNDIPYAELWIGAHDKSSSEAIIDGKAYPLNQLISDYPVETLSQEVLKAFSNSLPFLLKVISVGKALSIQVHPDKQQAKLLNIKDPEHYKDCNHKPEIAIALDFFTALVGLKKYTDIIEILNRHPEISEFIGQNIVRQITRSENTDTKTRTALIKSLFSSLIDNSEAYPDKLTKSIEALKKRLENNTDNNSEIERVFLDLRKDNNEADVGLFIVFFMNLIKLLPGQSFYAEPGTLHVYLKGNIVECMANSDNVVRVGLTTKFKDKKTLLEIMHYSTKGILVSENTMKNNEVVYKVPVPDFEVTKLSVNTNQSKDITTLNKPVILLVTEGNANIKWVDNKGEKTMKLHRGQSVFIPAILDKFTLIAENPSDIFMVTV